MTTSAKLRIKIEWKEHEKIKHHRSENAVN